MKNRITTDNNHSELKTLNALLKKLYRCESMFADKFFVYGILCKDETIYIGKSNRIHRRIMEHVSGIISNQRTIEPKQLIYLQEYDSNSAALKEESILIKALNPSQNKHRVWSKLYQTHESHNFKRTIAKKHRHPKIKILKTS